MKKKNEIDAAMALAVQRASQHDQKDLSADKTKCIHIVYTRSFREIGKKNTSQKKNFHVLGLRTPHVLVLGKQVL